MSNPFNFISRRGLLRVTILSAIATTPIAKALGAIPVSQKLLNATTSNSISISISATTAVRAYIEYGYSKTAISGKTQALNIAKGVALKANTLVYYRIKYAIGTSTKYASLTQKSAKTAVAQALSTSTFAIQADPHMDQNSSAAVYESTLKQIVAASPAFLMDLGDIFMVDKLPDKSEANIRGRFELMKNFYKVLGNIPLKICLGNHDGELGYSKFNTKNYRKEYFPEQTGELAYYSFTGPDQLHVVLDPFTYTMKNPSPAGWEWTLGKTQYDWLVETFKNSKERHKFIYIHQSPVKMSGEVRTSTEAMALM
jgi:Calcineurin-like phosphoesterase